MAVRAAQSYEREPARYFLLVLRMYVVRIAYVYGHGHCRVVKLQCVGLCLAQRGPFRLGLHCLRLEISGKLHEIER